jgi:hypothetical protein
MPYWKMVKKETMMITVSVDVGYVDVDVDLEYFDDDDLVDELESRDYVVYHEDDERDDLLSKEDRHALLMLIDSHNPDVGSPMYFIREKIANGA